VQQRDAQGELIGVWNLSEMVGRPVKAVGIAVGPDGKLWVTDTDGGAVIMLEPPAG
jgi:streptogramin lyase